VTTRVVRDVVIGGEDDNGDVARKLPDAQQRIQYPRSGAGVARLDDQPIWRELRGETGIVRIVLATHHDHVLVGACEKLRPATRAIQ